MDHLQILIMVHSDDSSMIGYRWVQEAIALEENENDCVHDVSGFQCMASVYLHEGGHVKISSEKRTICL
jgi:hypothetical protein